MTTENPHPDVPPPDAILLQMLMSPMLEKSICISAKLGIADLLKDQPRSVEELASETKTHAPSLRSEGAHV